MRHSLLALLIAAASVACDARQPDAAASETPRTSLECSQLALADSSAQPLEWVPLRGVPRDYEGLLYAELRTAGDSVTSYAFTGSNAEGQYSLLAPLHPGGTVEGGAVTLLFTDGVTACPAITFTVEPMAPAPGTFSRVTAGVQDYLRAQAAAFGATPDELRQAEPDTLFPPLIPLWIAQAVLDSAVTDSPFANSSASEADSVRQLLDALMAQTLVPDSLPALVEQVDSLRSLPGADPAGLRSAFAAASFLEEAPSFAAAPAPIFSFAAMGPAIAQTPAPTGATAFTMSASELDMYMSLAMSADIATSGRAGEIFGGLTDGLALVGMVAKWQKAEPIAAALGAMSGVAFAYQQTALAAAKLLPRRFTNLTYTLDQPVFAEDDPGPGSWDKAVVTAVSEGWQLDEAALNILTQTAGSGKFTKNIQWIDAMPAGALRDLAIDLQGFVLGSLLNTLIGKTAAVPGGPMQLGPYTFTADITDPAWREVQYAGGAVQAVIGSKGKEYEPVTVGSSTITISTPPKKFGFQLIRRDELIVVEAIEVAINPPQAIVEPGDMLPLMVTIGNALDGAVELETTAGLLFDKQYTAGAPEEHVWSVTLRTPDMSEPFPVRFKATSAADRSHLKTVQERSATARIDINQLEVLPEAACIRPGGSQTFTALLGGKPTTEVRWSASRGRISGDGAFREPGGNGTATITAVLRDDQDVQAEVDIRYGEQCNMYWKANVGAGQHTGAFAGAKGTASISGHDVTVTLRSEPDARPFVMVVISVEYDELDQRVAVGQCSVEVAFGPSGNFYQDLATDQASQVCSGHAEPPRNPAQDANPNYRWPYPAPATVEIRRIEDGYVEGWAEGRFYRSKPDPGDPSEQGTVRIEFRVPLCTNGLDCGRAKS